MEWHKNLFQALEGRGRKTSRSLRQPDLHCKFQTNQSYMMPSQNIEAFDQLTVYLEQIIEKLNNLTI